MRFPLSDRLEFWYGHQTQTVRIQFLNWNKTYIKVVLSLNQNYVDIDEKCDFAQK